MKSFVYFTTLIAVALAAQGIYYGKKPYFNSFKALNGEFPYQAYILSIGPELQDGPSCGGTIIYPTAVLTAGLCCISNYTYVVMVGWKINSEHLYTYDQYLTTTRFTRHEGLKEGVRPYNNLCIVHLEEPIKYSTYIQPAALPNSGATPTGIAILSGFGSANIPNLNQNGWLLRKAILRIISIDECGKKLASDTPQGIPVVLKENSGIICTSSKTIRNCVFDLGGPLVQNGVVVGVVSYTYRFCGVPNSPPIYTDVSHYIDWILRHATNNSLPTNGTKGVDTEDDDEGLDLEAIIENLFKQLDYYLS